MTYSERVRMAMKTANNPTHAPMSLAQVASITGYSYEHHRKVFNGEPVASRQFNDVLCNALGLDADEMWRLSQSEKVAKRLGSSFMSELPQDKRLVELWPKLSDVDRERVVAIVAGMAAQREVEASDAPTMKKPKNLYAKKVGVPTARNPWPNGRPQ